MNSMSSAMARAIIRALGLVALVGAMLAWAIVAHAGADVQRLLRDPFERPAAPAAPKTANTAMAAATAEAAPAAATATAPSAPPWTPTVRAVMYEAGRGRSLVNIGGAVLGVGEAVRGYRVVKINERSVVVVKDGARLTLTLDNGEDSQ